MNRRFPKRLTRVPLVERAFQLARSEAFSSVYDIALRLRREGYDAMEVDVSFEGSALRSELAKIRVSLAKV